MERAPAPLTERLLSRRTATTAEFASPSVTTVRGCRRNGRWTATQGIGIANTRERLRQLYGEHNQSLKISEEPGGGVRVDLSLPFRSA